MPDSTTTLPSTCDSDVGAGRRRSQGGRPRFVQLRVGFDRWCAEHSISAGDRTVLSHLILEADWQSGAVSDFSLTRCSAELGYGRASGRRTLAAQIKRLVSAGAVSYQAVQSRRGGVVQVLAYRELVDVKGRDMRAARITPPRDMRAARSPELPYDLGVCLPVDVLQEDVEAQTTPGGETGVQREPAAPSLPGSSSGRDLRLPDHPEVEAACVAIGRYAGVEPSGRWARSVAGLLAGGVSAGEIDRVMRWALVDSDFWPTSGCDVPALLAKFDTLRHQSARARRRRPNPLTAPIEDRDMCGLVAL